MASPRGEFHLLETLRRSFRSPQFVGIGVFGALATAIQVAGVASMLAAKLILATCVWGLVVVEIWASNWIKRTGAFRHSIVLAATCLVGFASVYAAQIIAELKKQQTEQTEQDAQKTFQIALAPLLGKVTGGKSVQQKVKPLIDIPGTASDVTRLTASVVLGVLERRISQKIGADTMRVFFYGLVAIVRITNNDTVKHQLKALEVVGNVTADFNYYMSAFSKGDGTESIDDLQAEWIKKRPYIRLSWIAHPRTDSRLQPGDELFVPFIITEANGSFGNFTYSGELRRYLGLSDGTSPEILKTQANVSDLVLPVHVGPDKELDAFRLKDEVKKGSVRFRLQVDSTRIDILPKDVHPVQRIFEEEWQEQTPSDMFVNDHPRWLPYKSDPTMNTHDK